MEVLMAHVDEGHRAWDYIQTFEYLMKDLRHDPREARKQDALFAALARLTQMTEGLKVILWNQNSNQVMDTYTHSIASGYYAAASI